MTRSHEAPRLDAVLRPWLPRLLSALLVSIPAGAAAHDLRLQLDELQRGVTELGDTVRRLRRTPAIPQPPRTRAQHLRVLGEAEIEQALGNDQAALRKLMGRLADASFRQLPEYVPALLLTAQILEDTDEPIGAMLLSRRALERGGTPEQMAEAGARWFRIARRQEHLEDRSELLALWRQRGAGVELAVEAAYEAAFALRAYDQREEARKLLASIPAESTYGSRAAYLAGVIFVESGDLANAERWFAAIMDWPIPPVLDDGGPQRTIEQEIRELAALSAGRLRYERGDLDGADTAYGKITDGSPHQSDACYERAYLALERKRRRGALVHLQCVADLGARGERWVDVRLTRASLLAHLARYSESVQAYEVLHKTLARERNAVVKGLSTVPRPSEFLFEAMERSAVAHGREATPGPATVFGDAWSAEVDRAYRLDRDLLIARTGLKEMLDEILRLRRTLDRIDAFPPLENRRRAYEQILREIHHLQGHAGDLVAMARERHADASGHGNEAAEASRSLAELDRLAREVEAQFGELDREEQSRRAQADRTLRELEADARALATTALGIGRDVALVADEVSQEALDALRHRYDHAVMRAEAGVLDTYWIRKEHVSGRIREIGEQKENLGTQFDAALESATDLD